MDGHPTASVLVLAAAHNRLAEDAAATANRAIAPGLYPAPPGENGDGGAGHAAASGQPAVLAAASPGAGADAEGDCGGCRACLSTLSPAAYLVDLMRFLEVTTGQDLRWFEARFRQGWPELPMGCAAVEEAVLQARLAVEVLERLLLADLALTRDELYAQVRALPVDGEPLATPDVLARGHSAYLTELGTTQAEAAVAVAAGAAATAMLATRLRVRPDEIPLLATDPGQVAISQFEALPGVLRRARLGGIDPLTDPDAERDALASVAASRDRVDTAIMPVLRDSLVRVAVASLPATDPYRLGEQLHLDLTADGGQRTTRIALAIATIQSLVQAVRLGREQLPGAAPDDRIWSWMGSYGTWHAAQTIFLHPEAFALPGVRRDATPAFATLLEQLDDDASPRAAQEHVARYRAALESYRQAELLHPQQGRMSIGPAVCAGRVLLFSRRGDLIDVQEQRADGTWTGLRVLSGLPGALLLDVVGFNNRIYLFFRDPDHTDVLRFSSMQPDGTPGTALASTPVGTPVTHASQLILIAGDQLSAYILFTNDSGAPAFRGICMDRFERWRPTVPPTTLPSSRFNSGLVTPIGYADSSDWFLVGSWDTDDAGQDTQRISLCRTTDPYGPPNDTGPFPDPRHRTTVTTLWDFQDTFTRYDCAGTVYRGALVVVVHIRPDNTTFIRINADGSQDYGASLGDFSPYAVVTDGERLFLYGGQVATGEGAFVTYAAAYAIAQFEGQQITVLSRGRTTIDPDQFENHPVGGALSAVRAFAQLQRDLYAQVAPTDLMRLLLDEWYLHVPLAVADALTRGGHHKEAADWLHVVFHPYLGSETERLVHAGFTAPHTTEGDLRNTLLWLRSPFDPHAVARVRDGAYLRLTILTYLENLLDWADRLFARDSPESLGQARDLYQLVLSLIDPTRTRSASCAAVLVRLERDLLRRRTGDTGVALRAAVQPLRAIASASAQQSAAAIRAVLDQNKTATEELRAARELVRDAVTVDSQSRQVHTLEELVAARRGLPPQLRARQIPLPTELNPVLLGLAGQPGLPGLPVPPAGAPAASRGFRAALLAVLRRARGDAADVVGLAGAAAGAAGQLDQGLWWLPVLETAGWCTPPNPVLAACRLRAVAAAEKIRAGCNAAGLKRTLPAYATPVDPAAANRQAADGSDVDVSAADEPPPIYRYQYLLERARAFAATAQQLEASLLAALQQGAQREYDLIRAEQDLNLAKANLVLQRLRVTEAQNTASLAVLQQNRINYQLEHFEELLDGGLSEYEQTSLELMFASAAASAIAAAAAAFGTLIQPGGAASATAAGLATGAQLVASSAGFERREQEWRYQRNLATHDAVIAAQHVLIAGDQVAIADQEQEVASVRDQHARDVVSFLGERFDNVELFRWMTRTLRRIYREHLVFALTAARMAQRALSFERQEALSIVAGSYTEYWDSDREGLLAAERLLLDINKLDQHRFVTERRKLELTKTISLAGVAPVEFQRLRETGRMEFVTLLDWFDRDFLGHYLRLIKNVSLTFVALAAPYDGIHATLSSRGVSQVVVSPNAPEPATLLRQPEVISVTVSPNGTGLFEVNLHDDLLLPFENQGVELLWTLEVPHATNRIVRDSLVDVLMTIRYTALQDDRYRATVLDRLGADQAGNVPTGGQTYYSARRDFADEWYHLNNPVFTDAAVRTPYEVEFALTPGDFPPNEQQQRVRRLTIAAGGGFTGRIPVKVAFHPAGGTETQVEGDLQDGRLALRPSAAFPFGDGPPFGTWKVRVRNEADPAAYPELFSGSTVINGRRRLALDWLTDLLLVLEYRAVSRYPV
ncbi:hypothetical protein PV458_09455 [Streptomyces sp. MN03-5084-2B]|nr:hypothetical protein [Streptomyces sp. MN03-5084-2B]